MKDPSEGMSFLKSELCNNANPTYNNAVRSMHSVSENTYETLEYINNNRIEHLYDTIEGIEAKSETSNREYTSETMKKNTGVKASSSYEEAIKVAKESKVELFQPDKKFKEVKTRTLSSSFPKGKAIVGGIATVLIGVGAIVAGVLVGLDKTGTLASSPEQVAFEEIQALSAKYWEIRTQYQTVLSTLKANIK